MNLLPGVLVLALLQLTAAQLQPEADSPGVVTDWDDPDPVRHNAQTVLLSQPHHDWREGVCVDPPSLSLSHPEPVAPVLDLELLCPLLTQASVPPTLADDPGDQELPPQGDLQLLLAGVGQKGAGAPGSALLLHVEPPQPRLHRPGVAGAGSQQGVGQLPRLQSQGAAAGGEAQVEGGGGGG